MRLLVSLLGASGSALALGFACGCSHLQGAAPAAIELAQPDDAAEPREVFERFLALQSRGPLSAAERAQFLEGELVERDLEGSDGAPRDCDAIVRVDATHAVARVTIEQPARKLPLGLEGEAGLEIELRARKVDTYWFLSRSDRWRVGAVRALAQTGLFEMQLALPQDTDPSDAERADSRANARLVLSTDKELAAWFRERKGEIEALAQAARGLSAGGTETSFSATSVLGERLRALHVTAADVLADGGVDLVVGGLTDNRVILRHVPGGARPAITPHDVIWAEALGGDWFLLRTT